MRSVPPVLLLLPLLAGPVLAQGNLYSRAAPPDSAALDRLNLKSEWASYVPVQNRQDGLARVQAVDEQQVFVQTRGGLLVALDAVSGREQWKTKFPAGFTEGMNVAVNHKYVFSVNVSKLFCHQRFTGTLEFDTELPEAPAVGPVMDGDALYIVFSSGKIACYDLPPTFQESVAANDRLVADLRKKGLIPPAEVQTTARAADEVANRNPGRGLGYDRPPEQERFHVPKSYLDAGVGMGSNQPTFSVAGLQTVTPPYFLGGLNKVVSVAMLPSVVQPYTLKPEYLTYNQLTPSVAAIPPSLARLYQLSNLKPPPFAPKMRWLADTRGTVAADPVFNHQRFDRADPSGLAERFKTTPTAPAVYDGLRINPYGSLWVVADNKNLRSLSSDADDKATLAENKKPLAAKPSAGAAGPFGFGKRAYLFLPLSDGQVLAYSATGDGKDFRVNVGGLLNRVPVGAADGVYVGGDRTGTARINMATQEVDWRTDDDIDRVVAVSDAHVFARDRLGTLYMYAKGKADPNTLMARPVGKLAAGDFGVTVVNPITDRVLLAADNGLVVCLRDGNAKAGKPKRIATPPPDVAQVGPKPKDPKPVDPKDPKPVDPPKEPKKDEPKDK